MNRGGRLVSNDWEHVTKNSNLKTATCNSCKQAISCKIERVRAHLKKCQTFLKRKHASDANDATESESEIEAVILRPPNVASSSNVADNPDLSTYIEKQISNPNQLNSAPIPTTHTDSEPEPPVKKCKLSQPKCADFVIKTTKSQKEKLDILLAKFFYSANIAFKQVESKVFRFVYCLSHHIYLAYLHLIKYECVHNVKLNLVKFSN